MENKKNHFSKKNLIFGAIGIGVVIVGVLVYSTYAWYMQSLGPIEPKSDTKQRFVVKKGDTTSQVGKELEKAGLIQSSKSFELYIKLSRPSTTIQTGTYALTKSFSVEKIIKHLESGKTDLFFVTIFPGATLDDIRGQLQKFGYKKQEIDNAFKQKYTSPLLADKPAEADLEGYIFPETYEVSSSDQLSSLFSRDFDGLYSRLQKDGYIEALKDRGYNLHQALTLASIIQKEASDPKDQRQIAQVLYKRLSMDMKLEVDPTFIYAAKKLGVEPRVDIDSPYNTRLYKGIPPGPISNMNYSALSALVTPAEGDYLYFVAGDDGTVYFSRTFEEHQANINKYCTKQCQ